MKETKIFLLAGKARCGKDTAANFIEEYYENEGKKVVRIGFADYIKGYAMKLTNWDGSDKNKPRELLQTLGTDIVRNKIDINFFINRVCEDIRVYKYFVDVIIISGARFPNELDIPKKSFENVNVIKIERPGFVNELTDKQKAHSTEVALDNYDNFDYVLINDNLELFKDRVRNMIQEVEHGN